MRHHLDHAGHPRYMSRSAGLRDEIAALNEGLEADFGVRLSVRIGVNTGQVVAGLGERLAAGDAVNVAARLEQAAAQGEVIIGPQAWRLVREAVTTEPLEPLPLKGGKPAGGSLRLTSGLGAVPLGPVTLCY